MCFIVGHPIMLSSFIVGTALLIFLVDILIPLGVAGGVPYIILVLLAYRSDNQKAIPASAFLGAVLTILGFFFSPAGGELWKVLFNRFLALFAIWIVALACLKNKAREKEVQKLTEAINQSPNPVMITDDTGRIEYVNSAFEERSGYLKAELLGQTPRIVKSGKHSPEFYKTLWETILSGKTWQGDIYNRRKNGTLYWEYLQVSPLKDVSGKISHFFSLRLTDKQRELAEKNVNKLTHTLDQLPQAVLMTDLEGIIVFVNPAFEKITGYSKNDILGLNPNLLKSGNQTPDFYKQLWETITTGKYWRGEFHNKRKNGVFYWERAVISPVHNDEGVITHFIAIRDDITCEKEQAILVQKVQKQLATAEKLAGIGQLAAGVSHEVLNPLNIISIRIQMLSKKYPNQPELTPAFQGMLKEISRIEKILSGLLKFARAGSDKFESVSIETFISEDILPLMEDGLKLNNILIEKKWESPLPQVSVVRDEIRQVFINLLNNSKYAMPNGGKITIALEEILIFRKSYLRIRISDTGEGIKKEYLDKIFDPFFTTKPEGQGTGMGLSVSHGIVEKHGGNLNVESEEGKGVTFIIDLPVSPVY